MKRELSQKLDSIEVEKQMKKRSGQSFEELEERTAALRDSLALLKSDLLNATEKTQQSIKLPARIRSMLPVKYQPKDLFDWFIMIIGVIAVLSGLVLIIGIFRLPLKKKQPLYMPVTKKLPVLPEYPEPLDVTRDKVQRSEKAVNKPESVNAEDVKITRMRTSGNQDPFKDLRRQVIDKPLQRQVPDEGNHIAIDTIEPASAIPGSSNQQIIEAARHGLDIQEISRLYHLSTDQIALILKVAQVQIKK